MFWTPAFAGVTTKETFYELIKLVYIRNFELWFLVLVNCKVIAIKGVTPARQSD